MKQARVYVPLVLIVLLVAAITVRAQTERIVQMEMEPRDGLLIHLSQGPEDPHRVLMALSMAAMMAKDKPVLVYFDIAAINVITKDAEDIAYSHFTSSHEQLNKLNEIGVRLRACPGCLKAAGKTAEDLREGVGVADKDEFFNFADGRILTIDY